MGRRVFSIGLCLLGGSACSGEGADSAADDPALEPAHTADEVLAELPLALQAQFAADARPVLDAWARVMVAEEDGCPTYDQTNPDNWTQIPLCQTSTGATFFGTAYTDGNGHTSGDYSVTFLALNCFVDQPDGTEFAGNGRAVQTSYQGGPGDTYGQLEISGGFRWDHPDAEGWLASGDIPTIVAESAWYADTGSRHLSFDGSLIAPLGGFTAASFQSVSLGSDGSGACTEEPTGVFGLRDETDNWYLLTLDGSGDPSTPACDGCGSVTWSGQELGTGCLDLSDLLDFDKVPW